VNNYYQILGLTQAADAAQIRAAYKRLAMTYHPDHNPGSRVAEEKFKEINEAYHILSDPLKKYRYDAQLNYAFDEQQREHYRREENKRKYYRWQQAQRKYYVIDKEYFKIQALAFLVFIVIAGFCFALLHTANYMMEERRHEHRLATIRSLRQVDTLFATGRFDDAFALIQTLGEEDPLEYRFRYAQDSLMTALKLMADERFANQEFSDAVAQYLVLKKHEDPVQTETLRQISICEFYLGNYKESLLAMKHLHNQDPRNLQLIYEIGSLYLEKLEDPNEALHYFTMGTKLFTENLAEVYGPSYRLVMDPTEVPDIYFHIFLNRARTNLVLKNYEEAIKDCDQAITLRPGLGNPYALRALAAVELKNFDRVCTDLTQARSLGVAEAEVLRRKYCR
jgi:tetratricopeptide (TPR) repeat protein